ncbi:MAG: translation initiation factor IF-3 [Candidatus Vogelbacteria bacterium CG10_big_fil_rev_8_21_14_0_10_51_16]|uniref:Translation initiation factor IF-3 n=1 Tax=Candidatus Vogelbacteria bacterium CG10_big_fil_rev_8_21_14_0_10_51_16 TaxID=1975045 RepID=A0A2H0RF71_9BACT|nr:MAG: translation initiation factor IF-3 [Candidatus Vogelbacteria bacterium CG10_big_fil_rev_8_21_14_0_10_51_16]
MLSPWSFDLALVFLYNSQYFITFLFLKQRIRINNQITASEVRVIAEDGANIGVLSTSEALKLSIARGTDLIEISPGATPPVVKLMDLGKYEYLENKKTKVAKANAKVSELKTIQVKVGTGEHDLEIKAQNASKFLREGHKVKIDLFLRGRVKYMEFNFLKERLERILRLVTEDYRVVDPIKKSMKGLTVIIERAK